LNLIGRERFVANGQVDRVERYVDPR